MKSNLLRIIFVIAVLFSSSNAFANGLFGSIEFKSDSLSAIPRWQRVLEKIEKEKPIFEECDRLPTTCDSAAVATWRNKIKELKGKNRVDILYTLNKFANQWPYRLDMDTWGMSDYWASPKEFMDNSGDCEDYAIFKYVTLKELGFKNDELRIVVVYDVIKRIPHAVLAVKMDKNFVIMDSLFNAVLPENQFMQYVPYYSINSTTRWTHVMPIKN